ncbi:TPA: fimbrial biogenesis outer membrane usher protein [Klebsiella oxytoca]|nr:fimbrial biogenesis outer membrane usher protein [Klebsiella oxytoca]
MTAVSKETFNLHALEIDRPGQDNTNAGLINQGLEQIPGRYRMSVKVNGKFLFTREFLFEPKNDNQLSPVLNYDDLISVGFSSASLSRYGVASSTRVNALERIFPGTLINYDIERQMMALSIPQEYMSRSDISPGLHASTGVNVAFVNYDLSGEHPISIDSSEEDSYLLTLQNGLNLGAWHYRSLLNISSDQGHSQNLRNNYVERGLPNIKSRFVMGETDTPSDIFDSLRIRGMQLGSDESMLDDAEQNFSPVIHGIAPSQARVSVLKNGEIIYQTFVAAGPYILDKLPSEAANGELEIRITELNGKTTTYYYASSSLPVLLREGKYKYSVALGHLILNDRKSTDIVQTTYARGISARDSLYGGILVASDYKTVLGGLAIDMGSLGALSLDIAGALLDSNYTLGGIRTRYYKSVENSGTVLSVEGVTYPDKNYRDINNRGILSSIDGRYTSHLMDTRKVTDIQINLNQQLPFGSIFASLSRQTYRNKLNNRLGLNIGFNTTVRGMTLNLSAARIMHYLKDRTENQLSLYLQIPFDIFDKSATAGISLTSSNGEHLLNTSLTGSALENDRLTYSFQTNRTLSTGQESMNLSASYYASRIQGRLGYAQNATQKKANYELKGGVVAHSGGLTYSQPPGDTFAIISTSGTEGIRLAGSRGVVSDSKGFLIAPSLTPYRKNAISLEMPDDNVFTEIAEPVKVIMPAYGAADMVDFKVKNGLRGLFLLRYGTEFVPFGATVTTVADENDAAIVDPNGHVYLTGLAREGEVIARWGRGKMHVCKAKFRFSAQEMKRQTGIISKEVQCR